MRTIKPTPPHAFTADAGVTDLWWPFGPSVGRYTFKTSAAETRGGLAQLVIRDGRGAATPLHVHHDTDETFYVLAGTLTLAVGDEVIEAAAGDFVFAPKGIPHAFLVTSERAEFLVTMSGAGTKGPEGHGIHGFFQEVATPVVDGVAPPAPEMPDAAYFARRMAEYGIELVGPPPFAEPAV